MGPGSGAAPQQRPRPELFGAPQGGTGDCIAPHRCGNDGSHTAAGDNGLRRISERRLGDARTERRRAAPPPLWRSSSAAQAACVRLMPSDVLGCTRAALMGSASLRPSLRGSSNLVIEPHRNGDRLLQSLIFAVRLRIRDAGMRMASDGCNEGVRDCADGPNKASNRDCRENGVCREKRGEKDRPSDQPHTAMIVHQVAKERGGGGG